MRRSEYRSTRGRVSIGAPLSVITVSQRFLVSTTAPVTLGSGSYVPTDEGGAVLWLDMQDATAYTLNGGSTGITQVKNKISNVQWAVNGTDCPFEATGINGHPCAHPTLIGHGFISTESAVVSVHDCPNTTKPYTLIYVALPDSTTTGVVSYGVGNSGVSSASTRVWGQRAGVATYEYNQTSPAAVGSGTHGPVRSTGAVNAGLNICAWHSPGVGVKLSLNNGADDPNNTVSDASYVPGTGPNRAMISGRPDLGPDSPAIQRWGEYWLFNKELDSAALTRVYNYLIGKWS